MSVNIVEKEFHKEKQDVFHNKIRYLYGNVQTVTGAAFYPLLRHLNPTSNRKSQTELFKHFILSFLLYLTVISQNG